MTIADGSRVRVLQRSQSGDPELDELTGKTGLAYDVCYFVPAGAKGNDDPGGRAYYLLDEEGSYGGSHWAFSDDLEVLMTPEEKRARKPPPVKDIRDGVASAVIGMYRPVDPDQVDHEDDDSMLVTGKTADGLSVAFRVTVSDVENLEDW